MKTEDLIGALVADNATRTQPLGSTMAVAAVVGVLSSGLLFWVLLGPRPDVATAIGNPRFVLKFVECAVLAAAAGTASWAAMHPAADRRLGRIGLFAAVAIVATGVLAEALLVPSADWGRRLLGTNWLHCLTLVPLIALPALAVLVTAARRGASIEPGRTGAVLGITAGAIGAFFYAANCTDDSPFFVATWYTLAIAATGALGALVGRRSLVW